MSQFGESSITRRRALQGAVAGLGLAAVGRVGLSAEAKAQPGGRDGRAVVCLFSKPLQNRPVTELPALLPTLGVRAVDLTCRPEGHVLPERVADDLPRAVELLAGAGISVPMISTAITDADEDHAEPIVKTAARLGIRHLKLGYYRYGDPHTIYETLTVTKTKLRGVTALCKQHGVQAGYHNHSGPYVGAAMWDLWQVLEGLDAEAVGAYFDLGHATAEGATAGWRIGLDLLLPRIVMLAVKDPLFERHPQRGWRPEWKPLGEGMARLGEAFKRLAEQGFAGPISMHMEYGPHNAPVGSPEDQANLVAIRRDMEWLGKALAEAKLE